MNAVSLALVGCALALWPSSSPRVMYAVAVAALPSSDGRDVRAWVAGLVPVVVNASSTVTRVVAGLCTVAGGSLAGLSVSWPFGVVAGLAVGVAIVSGRRYLATRRTTREQRLEVAAVAALADELTAGQPMAAALQAASATAGADLGAAFAAAARAVEIGADGVEVLTRSSPGDTTVADRVGGMWRLSIESGCPLAEAMQALEADLRDNARHRDQLRALLAGPASSAFLLAGLPVFGLVMGGAVGAHPWYVLTRTPVGGVVLLLGCALSAAGVLWTQAIIRQARRWA